MENDNIDRIKHQIFLRTLVALVIVGSVLVATVMVPLRGKLEKKNDQETRFTVEAKTTAVDQFVSKIINIAEQVASRTQIRSRLADYNQGKVTRRALAAFSAPKLNDALSSAPDAVGIARLDATGKLAVAVGESLPNEITARIAGAQPAASRVYNPVVVDGKHLVIVATPIRKRDGSRLGTDIVLFRTNTLRSIVRDYTGLGKTGEILLVYRRAGHFLSVFPTRLPYDETLVGNIIQTYDTGQPGIEGGHRACANCVVTIRPVQGTDWHLLFRMTRSELNAIIDAMTIRLLVLSALVLVGGMVGVYLLTYPLLHRLGTELTERTRMLGVLEAKEQNLTQTQQRLEEDVRQRMRAENELRRFNEELEQRVGQRTRQLEASHAELKQAYDDLKAAHSHMLQQEKLASIGQLAAGVAHELNNPLGFVLSNLGTLRHYCDDLMAFLHAQDVAVKSLAAAAGDQTQTMVQLEQQREALDIDATMADIGDLVAESLDGGDRMKQIILNLKSFARIDGHELRMANITEGLESTLHIVWNELKYKATVKKHYGEIPPTLCNLGELNQVFMNLLVNAAQAIDKKGEIRLETKQEDGWIVIIIADTGCGIPADRLNRIFEPFYTTKAVGKGTGLGLSIAYDIVKKHQGEISVVSQPGQGTQFTVKIPIRSESGVQ